jgi:hypothetical protein
MSLYLFSFNEPIASNYLPTIPPYLRISPNTTYDVLVMRLLTSTVKLKNTKYNKNVILDENYTNFPYNKITRKSGKQIRSFISPVGVQDFIRFSQKFYGRNILFYHNLLQELTFYFYYSHERQHQAAFVNLYRTLEYMSFSFPMIHVSHFGNIIGSFNSLKGYFAEDIKTSEIKFFERFIERLFNGTPYLGLTTTFNFSSPDINLANNCFDAFNGLSSDWTVSNRPTHNLEIENKYLIQLFKNIRNKYFHFAVGGQRNLQNIDLKDPDFFFEKINKPFLNWFAFIYKTMIIESVDNALL